jgi:hypothetical protein
MSSLLETVVAQYLSKFLYPLPGRPHRQDLDVRVLVVVVFVPACLLPIVLEQDGSLNACGVQIW